MSSYLRRSPFFADSFVNIPQSPSEIVHLDGVLQSLLEKVVIVSDLQIEQQTVVAASSPTDLVHQFVEDGLEVDGFVIFILWKRGGKENEWSEVEGVPIELTLLPHADTFKSSIGVIFPSDHTTTD